MLKDRMHCHHEIHLKQNILINIIVIIKQLVIYRLHIIVIELEDGDSGKLIKSTYSFKINGLCYVCFRAGTGWF